MKAMIGWSRDDRGIIKNRHIVEIANCITSFSGGGITGKDGLANCTPYVIDVKEYDTN